jgi:hypothetical protein
MRKQTNTLSPSPKGCQSPIFSDSDFREVRGFGHPKSSDYYFNWIVFRDYYVAFQGLLLYLDSFQGLLRCFSGIITVPGFFSGIITVPGFFSGIITTPLICLGIITVLIAGMITTPLICMGIITVFHFRDYYYPPISGIIPPPHQIAVKMSSPISGGVFF